MGYFDRVAPLGNKRGGWGVVEVLISLGFGLVTFKVLVVISFQGDVFVAKSRFMEKNRSGCHRCFFPPGQVTGSVIDILFGGSFLAQKFIHRHP